MAAAASRRGQGRTGEYGRMVGVVVGGKLGRGRDFNETLFLSVLSA